MHVKGLTMVELYAMVIYVVCYAISVFQLLLFSFADTTVLPAADDPQVCVIFTCNMCFFLINHKVL